MANFLTCWLQDPGDLPPGDGPPGGGGSGGSGGEDDEDEPCTGPDVRYFGCILPPETYDEDINCSQWMDIPWAVITDNCTISAEDIPDCIAPGEYGNACMMCREIGQATDCDTCCALEDPDCDGFNCTGDGTEEIDCSPVAGITAKGLYDNGCKENALPNCTGQVDYCGFYDAWLNNDLCKADDSANSKNCEGPGAGPCEGYTCTKPKCDEAGDCAGPVPVTATGGCDQINDEDGNCISDGWGSCTDNNNRTWYSELDPCKNSTQCNKSGSCWAYKCEGGQACAKGAPGQSDTFDEDECCEYVEVGGEYCDCEDPSIEDLTCDCTYNGTLADHYLEKKDCLEACVDCYDGHKCINSQSGDTYGNCETDPDNCANTYVMGEGEEPGDCEFDSGVDDCFKTDVECRETGCECKDFILCGLAEGIDDDCDTDCEPIGWSVVTQKCLYDDEFDALDGKTCQKLFEKHENSQWYYEYGSASEKATKQQQCEDNCVEDTPPCFYCGEETPCYECKDIQSEIGVPSTCVTEYTVNLCTEDDANYTYCGTPTKNTDGSWNCGSQCYTESDCGDNCIGCDPEHYTDPDCDEECGLGGAPGGGGFSQWGGGKGFKRIYGPDVEDSLFLRNYSNRKFQSPISFLPVPRQSLRGDLFKDRVHVGILGSNNINKKIFQFSDLPYSDLSDSNIEKSIHDSLVLKMRTARDARGVSLRRSILSSIRKLIISDRLDELNVEELDITLNTIINLQDSERYAATRSPSTTPTLNSVGAEADALNLATEHIWPLNPDNYNTVGVAERMRTFKTLATDLEKGFPVTTAGGVTTTLYYDINDQIVLASSGTLTMSNGDFQRITSSNGSKIEIPVQSLRDRAGILSLEYLQKIIALLGEKYDFTMTVETDPTLRVDERYGLAKARKDFYMLTLETSGIEDLDRTNPFVAKTKSRYKYESNGPARNAWVNTEGKGAAFPYLELYVDAQDPIFNYITNDGIIDVVSKDFVLDVFNDPSLPVVARRGPVQTIILYPSDRTINVPTHSVSRQSSYGVRELQFEINPNPKRSDTWHPIFLKESLAFRTGGGITSTEGNLQAVQYSIGTQQINDQNLYSTGEPKLPRKAFGVREVFSTLKALKEDYVVPTNNTINWYEVYDRMSIPMMKYLHRECKDFNSFKSKLYIGKPSSSDEVNKLYPKVREFKTRPNAVENIKFIPQKAGDHTPITPTPLD